MTRLHPARRPFARVTRPLRRVPTSHLVGPAMLLFASGCVDVEYMQYRGVQAWPTGSAFVHSIDGVPVIEGLPDRPYDVIGLIDVYDDKPFWHDSRVKKKVLELAEENKADALVWLSDRVVSSGALKMGLSSQDPASIDTGRSTQPELRITRLSPYVSTQRRKLLRSSLLAITWKSPG